MGSNVKVALLVATSAILGAYAMYNRQYRILATEVIKNMSKRAK